MNKYDYDYKSELARLIKLALERRDANEERAADVAACLVEAYDLGRKSMTKSRPSYSDGAITGKVSYDLHGMPRYDMPTFEPLGKVRYASDEDVICGILMNWAKTPKDMRPIWPDVAKHMIQATQQWGLVSLYDLANDWCRNTLCFRTHCRKNKGKGEIDALIVLKRIKTYNKRSVT